MQNINVKHFNSSNHNKFIPNETGLSNLGIRYTFPALPILLMRISYPKSEFFLNNDMHVHQYI